MKRFNLLLFLSLIGFISCEDQHFQLKKQYRPSPNEPRAYVDFLYNEGNQTDFPNISAQASLSCGARVSISGGTRHNIRSINFNNNAPVPSNCLFTFDVAANVQVDFLFYVIDASCSTNNRLHFFINLNRAASICTSTRQYNQRISVGQRSSPYRLDLWHQVRSSPGGLFFCEVVGVGGSSPSPSPTPPSPTPSPSPPNPANCGIKNTNRQGKIVNGNFTSPNEWPWQVYLRLGNSACGGTIVNNRWIMTAAHCSQGVSAANILVYTGCHTLLSSCDTARSVSQKVEHPSYAFPRNDIALLRLSNPLTFSSRVRPVCLPTAPVTTPNYGMTIAGWGRTGNTGGLSPTLKEATVRSITDNACNQFYGNVPSNIVCVQAVSGETCNGDSGGFLGSNTRGGGWQQDGVTSFGSSAGCGIVNGVQYPEGYTEVYRYLGWINPIIAS